MDEKYKTLVDSLCVAQAGWVDKDKEIYERSCKTVNNHAYRLKLQEKKLEIENELKNLE